MFKLSSISSGLELLSVNHTTMYENSDLKTLKDIKLGGIFNNLSNDFLGIKVYNTLESCW